MKVIDKKSVVVIWLVEVLFFLVAALCATNFAEFPAPQPDTLLYCQGARRIVEGAPFSFSAGEITTTGTTSVLYPFILALPYALGARGSSLLAVGFFLNAIFLLVYFLYWKRTFEIWISDRATRMLATLLVVLSGQAVFCALAQSDIGIWMALSAIFAYGMARRRPLVYGSVLLLVPWFRPEGMFCVGMFGIAIILRGLLLREKCCRDWIIFAFGMLSALGVFGLNYCLTGECQFSSVANKGYFRTYNFWAAVPMIATDALRIVKGLLLGLADSIPRELHVVPLLGGGLLVLGMISQDWSRKTVVRVCPWLVLAAGTCLVVANSGWQNTNMDRYLVWLMPLPAMFVAQGANMLRARIGQSAWRIMLWGLPVYAACAVVVLACTYYSSCRHNEKVWIFVAECERSMTEGASIGTQSSSGIAYGLSNRKLKHLAGIYSPEFSQLKAVSALEVLKNNPSSRFDYWFVDATTLPAISSENRDMMLGEIVLSGPDGLELRRADWRAYDRSVLNLCELPVSKELVSQVIVGDDRSERAVDYEVIDRYGRSLANPILEISNEDGKGMFEVSRVVIGGTRMTVPLIQGKDAFMVVRAKRVVSCDGLKHRFSDSMRFNLEIDGIVVGEREIPLSSEGFTDGTVIIPGDIIKNSQTRVGILGDHLSCRYRFYQ